MYSICQTILPATSVEHSIECNFYNLQQSNLIVCGASYLNVYRIVRDNNNINQAAQLQSDQPLPPASCKLEFLQSFQFYGNIASLQKVKLGNVTSCKRDALVLGFMDAKLCIVEYNPETHDLKTVSMHYFEDESLRDGYVTNHIHPPIVRVDPENRCIAMFVYGRHIVVIPLDKEEEEDLEHDLYNSSSDDESMEVDGPIQKPMAGQVVAMRPAVNPIFRSPVLPSYKIDLSFETCGEKIDNIREIQFLHNYNDPTLVILHEPVRTWSGRVAMRQDTFSMVALSMNIHQHLQPIIWTVNNLPYDCLQILPVPKPIGGLLVIASNELIYLNQSVPAFGMSLNSFTKDSSAFPFNNNHDNQDESEVKKTEYINISLDKSQAVFLNHNKILFILKDGDVYLITLFNDDMRSIKNFNFERIASTVQPNCLTLCANNLLFIGSHVGDSVLAEIVGDLSSEEIDPYADDDEVDSTASNEQKEPIYLYEHDKLLNSSACGRICYGEAPNISENLHHDHREPYVELIATAGYYQNGSICVYQRTIKPYVEDTYELKNCGDLWTMKPSNESDPSNSRLLLNRDYETMVFSTKGELLELKREECAFDTSEPTILAANMGEDDLTVQVMSTGVLLISNDKTIQHIKFETKIYDASLADPHIIALTNTDTIYHVELRSSFGGGGDSTIGEENEEGGEKRQSGLYCHDVGKLTNGHIIALTTYKDTSGSFSCNANDATSFQTSTSAPTYWLITVDERGVFEIFDIPNFNRVYSVDNFPSVPMVIANNTKAFITDLDLTMPKVQEVYINAFGPKGSRPILFVRTEFELIVYEAYYFSEPEMSNCLRVRFKKIHCLILRSMIPMDMAVETHPQPIGGQQLALTNGRGGNYNRGDERNHHRDHHHHHHHHHHHNNNSNNNSNSNNNLPNLEERWLANKHWLKQFDNIGGYRGVFLAGFKPHWFLMSDRGELRIHPMNAEGSIYAFSTYDNDNFIYFNENRELRIARLPVYMNLDFHWPIRKLPMQETVWFVNYHVERKIYCVVTSVPRACTKIMKVGSEPDTMNCEDLERENGYIPPITEKFTLKLYDPEKWEEIPDCTIEFEEWEQVTCVKNVMLASEGTKSGLKGYIAISTNSCYGEDVPNRGRIWILDLIEVVPEPDRPLTKNKIKKVYCQEQKGPVTTLSHTCGLLMSAVGQKIYLWQLAEEKLDGVAFIDTQIYIHHAASIKNLILVGDMKKSVSLLRYQQETRTLSLVCRDPKELEVFACDFAVDNELLNFVCTDKERNIIIYSHEPENEDSNGGIKLLRRADLHLGADIISSCRLGGRVPKAFANNVSEATYYRRRHLTLFATVDGAIGFVYPIDEAIHHYLQMLQNEMTISLTHPAGLNPKAWRTVKHSRQCIVKMTRRIIDGNMINRFLLLSAKERNDLTKKIGTTTDKILAIIQLIQESTMYF